MGKPMAYEHFIDAKQFAKKLKLTLKAYGQTNSIGVLGFNHGLYQTCDFGFINNVVH